MARRVVEALSGVGGVYAGDLLLRTTPYELNLWVDEDGSETATVSIDGHIDIAGMGEAIVLAGPQPLTLRLQDGRTLAFSLTGTGGGIVGRGGLQPA
jgi:hypothetical protein